MGFIIGNGDHSPRVKIALRNVFERPTRIKTRLLDISRNLHKIKHWSVNHGDFTASKQGYFCTYFIDPPYQSGGQYYKYGSSKIDYKFLSDWCRSLYGDVIVCENSKADWMEFHPFVDHKGQIKSRQKEVIWTNFSKNYGNEQLKMFLNNDE
jgi:16S rRNA G966 N2-methylase RsmD